MIRHLLEGLSNREIGERMNTTEQVIKNRFREVYEKCGAGDRTELVVMVMGHPEWIDMAKCPACGAPKAGVFTRGVMPKRIQRKRSDGWRAPEGVVNCTRPGRYGNPFRVDEFGLTDSLRLFRWLIVYPQMRPDIKRPSVEEIRRELRGRDLMCFCALDKPCHVDILLEIANGPASGGAR